MLILCDFPEGLHPVGFLPNGQIPGACPEAHVVFRLGKPPQEFHSRRLPLDIGLGDGHARALLDDHVFAAGKNGHRQNFIVNGMGTGFRLHLLGEVAGGDGGAGVGQKVPGFHVVGAEFAVGAEPTADHGHIVVVPELPENLLIGVHMGLVVFHLQKGLTQLLGADEEVVGQSVSAVEGLAVTGNVRGLVVRPLVVFPGDFHNSLNGGQILQGHAGAFREGLPVGFVQNHDLRGLGNGENPQTAVGGDAALLHIGGDVGIQLLLGEVVGEICQSPRLLGVEGGVGIGGEQIGQRLRAYLALQGIPDGGFQIVDGAFAVAGNIDALFLADGAVEGVHDGVKGGQLSAVVVVPDGQVHRLLRVKLGAFAAAACQQGAYQQSGAQRQRRSSLLFHIPVLLS